mmetsp:Transcript_76137/g.172154  ORF Transcript_76137/g.172154 Transcript_76137/m.172154 type:complete len:203 (+) Transcript_76137:302-910(+)
MRHEDDHREGVEEAPDRVLEDLELERVDVAHADLGDAGVVGPEEVQRGDAPEVDQEGRRADVVGAELIGVTETELEEVDGHESHQHQSRDRQVQGTDAGRLHQRKLHVPGPLQPNEGMENDGKQDVLLDNVAGQAKTGPVEAHIEVTVPVEVIRTLEDVKIANSVDDDENDEEDCTPRQTHTVVGDLDVCRRENGGTHLVKD